MTERYIVRVGKFGAYIYDVDLKKDMTLKDVVTELNFHQDLLRTADE